MVLVVRSAKLNVNCKRATMLITRALLPNFIRCETKGGKRAQAIKSKSVGVRKKGREMCQARSTREAALYYDGTNWSRSEPRV